MSVISLMYADWLANPRDYKARFVLCTFRVAHALRTGNQMTRLVGIPFIVFYRMSTELVMGIELRPRTKVGPGLTIYHGVGLVVNDGAIIGRNVVLRHNVTIGQARPGGPSPRIGDRVVFGAGSMVLGGVTVGSGAQIGAGAIVTVDVPANGIARGPKAVIN
jgi:putative colanic acid biosynthesis acetyltransferase WcaB